MPCTHGVSESDDTDSSIEEEIEYSDDAETYSSSYTGVSCYATVINQLAYLLLTSSISVMFLLTIVYKLLINVKYIRHILHFVPERADNWFRTGNVVFHHGKEDTMYRT